MNFKSKLMDYLARRGPQKRAVFPDGALYKPSEFPVAAVETNGAVLFADLPDFSKHAAKLDPVETACYVSHFFAWFEGSAGRHFGGIVDKFIDDEIMCVFLPGECVGPPLEAALRTAYAFLDRDAFAFYPKIGIASGPLAVTLVGTESNSFVTAMGHTVNLAARCAGGIVEKSIRIATDDATVVADLFKGPEWEVSELHEEKLKGIDEKVSVMDVERTTFRAFNFDYWADVRKRAKFAREHGAVKSEL